MTIITKICGLKTREAVLAADNAGADFLGFVFYAPSPRNISPALAGEISAGVKAKKVAVVVDADDELLAEIVAKLKPDFIQLHGSESDARASEIKAKYKIKLIKAFSANSSLLTAHLESRKQKAESIFHYILVDSPGGGTGKQFDYSNFSAPAGEWFLSGGLNAANVEAALKQTCAKMVDVSSGVEREKGVKDIALIEEFLRKVDELSGRI